MWPIPYRSNAYLVIGLHNDFITFSHFDSQKNNDKKPYILQSFHHYQVNDAISKNGVLYNHSILKKYISDYAQLNGLHDANVIFVMWDMDESEKVIASPNALPSERELYNHSSRYYFNNHIYLFSQEPRFIFYTYAIKKALIFQYQLFAASMKFNLLNIVFANAAFISLYQFIKGNSFRHAQLGQDLITHNYSFSKIVNGIETNLTFQRNEAITIQKNCEDISAAFGAIMMSQ